MMRTIGAALLAVFLACSTPVPAPGPLPKGQACTQADTCEAKTRCFHDRCTAECNTGDDCTFGEFCSRSFGVCYDQTGEVPCRYAIECPIGAVCENEICNNPGQLQNCVSTNDCLNGEACSPLAHVCIPHPGCLDNNGCASNGETCDLEKLQCGSPDVPCSPRGDPVEQCGYGKICATNGFCTAGPGCQSGVDCAADKLCNLVTGDCLTAPSCYDNTECPAFYSCDLDADRCGEISGVGKRACRTDAECLNGDTCDTQYNYCERDGTRCTWDYECDDAFLCAADGFCAPGDRGQCQFDVDCADPLQCIHRSCVDPSQPCDPDGNEPNNSSGTAAELAGGTVDENVLCSGDEDWFSLVIPALQTLTIAASFDTANADVELSLYDLAGGQIAFSTGTGNTETVSARATIDPATVLLKVYSYSGGWNHPTPYTLDVQLADLPACATDANEPNNTSDAATPLEPGVLSGAELCYGDQDWYVVQAEAGQRLNFSVPYNADDGDLEILLYSPSGVLLDSGSYSNPETASGEVQAAGRYFLGVRATGQTNPMPYAIEFTVTAVPVCANPEDGNDLLSNATPLPRGTLEGAQVCQSDDDWYRIDAQNMDRVRVTLNFNTADADLDLKLWNAAGTTQIASSAGTSGTEHIDITLTANGPVFLRVYAFGGTIHNVASYTLTLEIDAVCPPDTFEPNNAFTAAADVTAQAGAAITGLGVCGAEDDWYKISAVVGQIIEVSVDAPFANGDLDLDLRQLQEGGTTALLDRSWTRYDQETLSYSVILSGDFLIRVYPLNVTALSSIAYTLTVNLH